MFEFVTDCELFGVEVKVSKKNNTYIVLTVLSDNGKTVDVMYAGDSTKNAMDLARLTTRKLYKFHFKVELGKYQKFYVTQIEDSDSEVVNG